MELIFVGFVCFKNNTYSTYVFGSLFFSSQGPRGAGVFFTWCLFPNSGHAGGESPCGMVEALIPVILSLPLKTSAYVRCRCPGNRYLSSSLHLGYSFFIYRGAFFLFYVKKMCFHLLFQMARVVDFSNSL